MNRIAQSHAKLLVRDAKGRYAAATPEVILEVARQVIDQKMQRDNDRISALTAEIDKLQAELGYEQENRELTLKMTTNCIDSKNEDAEEIVNKHIRLLHSYNEAKDATQVY